MRIADPPRDPAARTAGWLLLATAITTVVAVVGRVSAQADLATLAESLAAIATHRAGYGIGGAARLVSGLTLLAASWFLLRTWIMRRGLGSRPVPVLLGISGLHTAVSGACAVAMAVGAPEAAADGGATPVAGGLAAAEAVRWISGKTGFSLAGLALIAAAHRQWLVGGFMRPIAPVSAIIGIGMQLIWVDAAILAHRVTGPAFVVWLTAIGVMLVTGRVEERFAARAEEGSTDESAE